MIKKVQFAIFKFNCFLFQFKMSLFRNVNASVLFMFIMGGEGGRTFKRNSIKIFSIVPFWKWELWKLNFELNWNKTPAISVSNWIHLFYFLSVFECVWQLNIHNTHYWLYQYSIHPIQHHIKNTKVKKKEWRKKWKCIIILSTFLIICWN